VILGNLPPDVRRINRYTPEAWAGSNTLSALILSHFCSCGKAPSKNQGGPLEGETLVFHHVRNAQFDAPDDG
jgi:hypothetical protein